MTNENNKFIPKTYEQFMLEEQFVFEQQQGLYPELGYENINERKGYGPTDKEKTIAFSYYSDEEASANKVEDSLRRLGLSSDLLGFLGRSRRYCAALGCSYSSLVRTTLPEGEFYCSIHKFMMGREIADVAKSFNETASKEGGTVVVSKKDSTEKVEYHPNKK